MFCAQVAVLTLLGVARGGLFGLHGGHGGYGYGGHGHHGYSGYSHGYGHGYGLGYGHHHHDYHHHDYYHHKRSAQIDQNNSHLVEQSKVEQENGVGQENGEDLASNGYYVRRSAEAEASPVFGLFGRHHHFYPYHYYGHGLHYW